MYIVNKHACFTDTNVIITTTLFLTIFLMSNLIAAKWACFNGPYPYHFVIRKKVYEWQL
jgi:hypothetical protein